LGLGILWYFADALCAFYAVNVLHFGMGFGGIPYFKKMDSLHVKQLICHPLNWEWVQYNCLQGGCSYV
jgi:hypothetical protein